MSRPLVVSEAGQIRNLPDGDVIFGGLVAAKVVFSGAVLPPSASFTKFSFTEVLDTHDHFSASTPTKLSVYVGGLYYIGYHVNFPSNNSTNTAVDFRINGAVYARSQFLATNVAGMGSGDIQFLYPGAQIELWCYHSSSSNLTVTSGTLYLYRIGSQ